MDTQKKSLSASERDEVVRSAWWQEVQALAIEDLVFVDESGSHISMAPLYAWAPRGERASGSVPRNRGHNTTMVGAFSLQGMQTLMTVEGAADGAAFEVFVEHFLLPTLRPGQIVIMDNLSIHKGKPVRALIEGCGCQLLFLPSYSPDFSPIEQAWSKLKERLRRLGARTREALQDAIAQALDLITAQDAPGWFRHCGYA